jgi:hypothetical protein
MVLINYDHISWSLVYGYGQQQIKVNKKYTSNTGDFDHHADAISTTHEALPRAYYAHHDNTWGQFVDIANAEEELVCMSKFLSIRRHIDIPLMESGPLDF